MNAPHDLFEYMHSKYQNSLAPGIVPTITGFIEFARKTLRENQPVGTGHREGGMTLLLQDKSQIPLLVDESQAVQMGDACQRISNPRVARGGDLPNTPSFGITGNKQ